MKGKFGFIGQGLCPWVSLRLGHDTALTALRWRMQSFTTVSPLRYPTRNPFEKGLLDFLKLSKNIVR